MSDVRTNTAVEAVVRIESARLIAGLARLTGDVGLAEELAQDAVVAALEQWPGSGVPRNPGAWLMTVAKRRAIDLFRRNRTQETRYAEIGRTLGQQGGLEDPELERVIADDIDDDLLRLVFVACHPVLSMPARVALTLRLLGGLTTVEIARAYLVPQSTVAQRIVRAKKTLASAGVPFEVPAAAERGRAARVGPRGHLPDLQRGLLRDGRVGLDATGVVLRCVAVGPRVGVVDARRG